MENKEELTKKLKEYIDKAKTIFQEHNKIIVPSIVCVLVVIIAVAVMFGRTKKQLDEAVTNSTTTAIDAATESVLAEPLEQDAHEDVMSLMSTFYKALADGDMDTVKSLKDYTDDTEIITYQAKSEYIESYDNLVCYTKKAVEEGSYFVYEYYDARFYDFKDTTIPGLMTWYVYTNEEGKLIIDGNMDESVTAALKLATNTDEVVDLFNKVDVQYNEALEQNEDLKVFMDDLRNQIKVSVGVALASLQDENQDAEEEPSEEEATEEVVANEEVNEQVKTTDVVNVRKSDSEEADKLGKADKGLVMTRLETKANGWSKVIFEGNEAYIKSAYLEVISSEPVENTETTQETATQNTNAGSKVAKTNVNVRNSPKESGDAIGLAQAGQSYKVLGESDGWLKIEYKGQVGYSKAEFFE